MSVDIKDSDDLDLAQLSDEDLAAMAGGGGDDSPSGDAGADVSDGQGDVAAASGDDADSGDDVPPSVEALSKAIREERERREKLEKRLEDRERTIGRQGNELGQYRAQQERLQQLVQQRETLRQKDPNRQVIEGTWRSDWEQQLQLDQQIAAQQQQIQQAKAVEMMHAHRQYIANAAPDFESVIDDVCKAALDAGELPQHVQAFRVNPYASHPAIALTYYNKAKMDKMMSEYEAKLKAAQGKPKDMLDKINRTARKPLSNDAGTGRRGGQSADFDENTLADLTDAEFEALKKEMNSKK